MDILSGGVPDNNFKIIKWFAEDRGRRIPQYNPIYKQESLLDNQNPLTNLSEAKSVIKDWYSKRQIYLNYKKQGTILSGVEDLLVEKGMI